MAGMIIVEDVNQRANVNPSIQASANDIGMNIKAEIGPADRDPTEEEPSNDPTDRYFGTGVEEMVMVLQDVHFSKLASISAQAEDLLPSRPTWVDGTGGGAGYCDPAVCNADLLYYTVNGQFNPEVTIKVGLTAPTAGPSAGGGEKGAVVESAESVSADVTVAEVGSEEGRRTSYGRRAGKGKVSAGAAEATVQRWRIVNAGAASYVRLFLHREDEASLEKSSGGGDDVSSGSGDDVSSGGGDDVTSGDQGREQLRSRAGGSGASDSGSGSTSDRGRGSGSGSDSDSTVGQSAASGPQLSVGPQCTLEQIAADGHYLTEPRLVDGEGAGILVPTGARVDLLLRCSWTGMLRGLLGENSCRRPCTAKRSGENAPICRHRGLGICRHTS
jgi:hypothetical protein